MKSVVSEDRVDVEARDCEKPELVKLNLMLIGGIVFFFLVICGSMKYLLAL